MPKVSPACSALAKLFPKTYLPSGGLGIPVGLQGGDLFLQRFDRLSLRSFHFGEASFESDLARFERGLFRFESGDAGLLFGEFLSRASALVSM